MNKAKIKLVSIGRMPPHINLDRVSTWKSKIFELTSSVENFSLECDADGENWTFSDKLLKNQLPQNFDADFLIAIVNVPMEKNWYTRLLGDNKIVFSFNQIGELLASENIPIENAIFRALYTYTLLYRRSGNKIPEYSKALEFVHDETRGCLFDMNGMKYDIVESCNNPIVCIQCEHKLRNERISNEMIKSVQKEIAKIKKNLYYRAFDFVKKNPIISLIVSSIFAISLGILGSLIASYIYEKIKQT